MNLLAFELSTTSGSLALFRDGELLTHTQWVEQPRQHQRLFDSVSELLHECGLTPGQLDLYAVGRGPGNYTGLRMSITAAQAMALPERTRLHCVDSGVALARGLDPAGRIAVIGDARRGLLWAGLVEAGHLAVSWQLLPAAEFPAWLEGEGGADQIVSPDHARLTELGATLGTVWLDQSVVPTAEHVGRLVLDEIAANRPSLPEVPLYLQPPV